MFNLGKVRQILCRTWSTSERNDSFQASIIKSYYWHHRCYSFQLRFFSKKRYFRTKTNYENLVLILQEKQKQS
jgi:hypothetical protein